jgi:hypothetical protein
MCHTALPDRAGGTADAIAAARRVEFEVLAGEAGARCLDRAVVRPARWRDTLCGIAAAQTAKTPNRDAKAPRP